MRSLSRSKAGQAFEQPDRRIGAAIQQALDLMLLDVMMPELDGYALLARE